MNEMFFAWFRQRASNARDLENHVPMPIMNVPEQNLLVAASLDALGNHWAATFQPKLRTQEETMGAFLAECGGHPIFQRCSHTELLHLAMHDKTKGAPVRAAINNVLGRRPIGRVLDWTYDPELGALAREGELRSLGIKEGWLRRARFGEVIHRRYRCAWIHEAQASEHARDGGAFPEKTEPFYENLSSASNSPTHYVQDRRLALPLRFMLQTLDSAIVNFEAKCIAKGVAPVVML